MAMDDKQYRTMRQWDEAFGDEIISATNDLMRSDDREFGAESLRELQAFYPKRFAEVQEKNVDANLRLQETMNFGLDRFREEGDPWTQAGVDKADFNASVPYGFGGYDSMFGYGGSTSGGMATKDRIFMPGARADNPYYIAHEGRHLTTPGVGSRKEELANHQVDLNLANRFGNAKVADNALRFIAEEGSSRSRPIDVMGFQREYGKPGSFAEVDYDEDPELIQGKVSLKRGDMDAAGYQDLYETYRRADQFNKAGAGKFQRENREHPDVGWFDTYMDQLWR